MGTNVLICCRFVFVLLCERLLTIIKQILKKQLTLPQYLFNIDNPYFEQIVSQIYPTDFRLNNANSSDTVARFLGSDLSITNGIASTKH